MNLYEFEKYDAIDFMEYGEKDITDCLNQDCIEKYLNNIPDSIWLKFLISIKKQSVDIKDEQIIQYVIKKTTIDLVDFVLDNFSAISLETLQLCVETNFELFEINIKKNKKKYNEIIKICIEKHNLEFNKYFYESVYSKLEPKHIVKSKNIWNLFGLLSTNSIPHQNKFYKYFSNEAKNKSPILCVINEVYDYYDKKFLLDNV